MLNYLESLIPEDIIEINKNVDEGIVKDYNLVASCLSSFHYYNNIKDQISSIFKSIVLNHSFNNGNKRTAVVFLVITAKQTGNSVSNLSNKQLFNITLNIANGKLTKVEEISKLIFEK